MTALAAALAATAMTTAAADAATVTLTGDNGAPVALTPGANLALRNINPTLAVTAVAPEKYYDVSTVGPVTNATSTRSCFSIPSRLPVDYQGNGTYTVTVTSYTDTKCTTGKKTAAYQFTINAGVTLTGPAGRLLTRAPNDYRDPHAEPRGRPEPERADRDPLRAARRHRPGRRHRRALEGGLRGHDQRVRRAWR